MAGDVGLHEVPTTRNNNIGPQAVADLELWRGGAFSSRGIKSALNAPAATKMVPVLHEFFP